MSSPADRATPTARPIRATRGSGRPCSRRSARPRNRSTPPGAGPRACRRWHVDHLDERKTIRVAGSPDRQDRPPIRRPRDVAACPGRTRPGGARHLRRRGRARRSRGWLRRNEEGELRPVRRPPQRQGACGASLDEAVGIEPHQVCRAVQIDDQHAESRRDRREPLAVRRPHRAGPDERRRARDGDPARRLLSSPAEENPLTTTVFSPRPVSP